jgi:hypothetical protein
MSTDSLLAGMGEPEFTQAAKMKELEREIAMRERVYTNMVSQGTMTAKLKDQRIGVLQSILADYQEGRVRDGKA